MYGTFFLPRRKGVELDHVAADGQGDLHAARLARQVRVGVVGKQTLAHPVYRDTNDRILPRIVGGVPPEYFDPYGALFEEVLTAVQGTFHEVLQECTTALAADKLVAGSHTLQFL